MNRINAVPLTLNHIMRTSLRRPPPSRAGIAVLVGSLATMGLGSVLMQAAQAAAARVDCNEADLIAAVGDRTLDFLSLREGCIYTLTVVDPSSNPQLGNVGLPVITRTLTIKGNGATIRRSAAAGTPNFRIMEIDPGGDLTLDRVTLDNGNTSGTQQAGRGGGIYNLGTLKIEHSILSNNVAAQGGGGIGNGDAQEAAPPNPAHAILMLSDYSTLSDNTATANGGGIANGFTSTMNLTDCYISDNKSGGGGGGIASQGTAILNKCTITGNTAIDGGGLSNAGQLFLTDSPVTGNHAIADNSSGCPFTGLGGGIYNAPVNGSTVTLVHSPVTGNNAMAATGPDCTDISSTGIGGGIVIGAFFGAFGAATLTDNSDVTGNSAANGGGIANAGYVTLTHSNIIGNNSTGDGGGIFNLTDRSPHGQPVAALTLTHSDVTGNNAGKGQHGGGILNEPGNKVTLNDSTVTGNTPDDF